MAGEGSGFYWMPDGQALEEFKQELIPSESTGNGLLRLLHGDGIRIGKEKGEGGQ